MSPGRRVLVATEERTPPLVALEHAEAAAGAGGEVVLAAVLVVPLAQKLAANLDRSVSEACAVLEAGERSVGGPAHFDTRLVRARSFAEGVLETLAAEPFDLLVVERRSGRTADGMRDQLETLLEKAPTTVALIRPAPVQPGSAPAAAAD